MNGKNRLVVFTQFSHCLPRGGLCDAPGGFWFSAGEEKTRPGRPSWLRAGWLVGVDVEAVDPWLQLDTGSQQLRDVGCPWTDAQVPVVLVLKKDDLKEEGMESG